MEHVIAFLREIFPTKKTTLANSVIGISAGLSVYLGKLQRHFFSKSYFAYMLLLAVIVSFLVGWLRHCCLKSRFLSLSKRMRVTALVFTVLLALVSLGNTQIQPLYYLLPDTQLQIRIPIGEVPQDQESVRLLWVETGQGYVYYTNMHYEGQWERVEKNIVFAPNQEVLITWTGKVGLFPEIAFRMTHYDQPVFIAWNGVEKEYNLNNPKEPNILIQTPIEIPLLYKLPFILSFTISVGFIIFSVLILLGTWQPRSRTRAGSRKCAWLLYMLPMLLVWGFSLLVFWPGIMSADSITLWSQNLSGQYSDWQSAFYALILAGLMRVWYSPAVVSTLQILLASFLVAWGLKELGKSGVPRLLLWGISLLFAVLPVNNLFIITLWRDIPYALAVFWLTLIVLKIFLSGGEWVRGRGWIWLALSGFLIAILRQNGIPVVFGMLVLLPLVYRKYWKELAGSLLLCLVVFLLVKGPVFNWLDVDRSKDGQSNLILAHHIAAHLNAGTNLTTEEEDYLDSFLPVEDWDYYCCYVGTISYDNDFERERFLDSSSENRKLALDLFLRDPLVDVQHTLCSSELVWRYQNNQCYMKSAHGFNSWVPGKTSWINPNDVGLEDDSRFPGLVQPYVDLLRVFGFRDDFLVLYLRPALYLYLTVICVMVLIVRRKDLRASLIALPLLLQAGVLFLISYAPAIRYQYSNYLVGLFLLGLLFLPGAPADRKDE